MITSLDKNTALVLIDLQNGIVSLPLPAPVAPVLENCAALAAAFRKAGKPVILVNVNPTTNPVNTLRKDAKQPGGGEISAEWLEIVAEVEAAESDIRITKNNWNAFVNPDFNKTLQDKGITGIVLAGISTSVGVEGTARTAAENGYNTTYASDAMMDLFVDAHNHSLKYIFPRLGEVGATTEILEKL